MPTYEQLMEGARKADAAGDIAGAKRFLELARDAMRRPTQSNVEGTAEMNRLAEQGVAQANVSENPIGARAVKFVQGLPFAGQWFDEAMGKIGGPAAQQRVRGAQEAMDIARPTESALWQLGGGVAGSVAAAPAIMAAGGAAAPAIPGLGAQMLAGGAAGAGAGAIEGAVSGAGAANDGDRAAGAGTGALMGGGMGLALGAAAPAVGAGVRAAVSRWKGSDVAEIAMQLGISKEAARAVKAALDAEDMGKAAGNIRRAGPDAMLAEAGPATRDLADAVGQSGGAAGRIMRDAVEDRAAGGARAFQQSLDDAFGAPTVRPKANLGGAYDAAYQTPIDYSSDAGRKIEALMARVPKSEVARARRLIEMDPNVPEHIKRQFLVSFQPDGTISTDTLPSVMELDYVTRALGDVSRAGDGKGALGGNTNEGRIFGNLSKAIRDQVKVAVPAYGKALDAASTEIGIKNAGEFGATILSPSVTRKDVAEMLVGAPAVERTAAKDALRQAIDDQLANTRRLMTRPNTDVGEAIKGIQSMTTRASREKLATVLGAKEAAKLADSLDEAATAFEIQAAMSTNSRTAVRQAVQGSVKASSEPNVVQKLMGGSVVDASKRFVQLFTGATPEAREAVQAGIYKEIAQALTQTKGPAAERALMGITRAMNGQALTDDQARRLAKVTTTALVAGGYPTGTQMLQSRTR